MASIQKVKLKDGSYSYRISVLISSSGGEGEKQIRRTKQIKADPKKSDSANYKAVQRIAAEFEEKEKAKFSRIGDINTHKTTLRDYAEQWLDSRDVKKLEETTAEKYRGQLETIILPIIGHIKVEDICPKTIDDFLTELENKEYQYNNRKGKYSQASIKDAKATLSTMLRAAVKDGYLESNPCKEVKVSKDKSGRNKKGVKAFSLAQTDRFLKIIEQQLLITSPAHTVNRGGKIVQIREYISGHYTVQLKYKCAFLLAIFAGFRAEECCGLNWEDVDFKENTIEINKAAVRVKGKTIIKDPKTSAGFRKIYVPAVVMSKLKNLRKETSQTIMSLGTAWKGPREIGKNPVFCQVEGGRMHRSTFNKELHRVIRSWNASCKNETDKLPELTFHQLRHTSVTLLIAEGLEDTAIAARIGHSDVSTTLRIYAHSFEERDKAASNALEKALLSDKMLKTSH